MYATLCSGMVGPPTTCHCSTTITTGGDGGDDGNGGDSGDGGDGGDVSDGGDNFFKRLRLINPFFVCDNF